MHLAFGLHGERGARRARSVVESFRPRPLEGVDVPRIVLTGFGSFPNVPQNATATIIRAVADSAGVELHARSFRAPDFAAGRGALGLPSGQKAHASLMVLPVAWEAAAALVAKEARATRASLVIMSGVAAKTQPLFVEAISTNARVAMVDSYGMRPRRKKPTHTLNVTIDAKRACEAAQHALARESTKRLSLVLTGVELHTARDDNAYVCNATAYGTALLAQRARRVLRTAARPEGVEVARTFRPAHGFLHWPQDIAPEDASACARVLLAVVEAVLSAP
jgi:pyrrolidone-carboxylate peptidase